MYKRVKPTPPPPTTNIEAGPSDSKPPSYIEKTDQSVELHPVGEKDQLIPKA
jgi:hypothetical protein